jgi:hypothetical protein
MDKETFVKDVVLLGVVIFLVWYLLQVEKRKSLFFPNPFSVTPNAAGTGPNSSGVCCGAGDVSSVNGSASNGNETRGTVAVGVNSLSGQSGF